MTKFIKTLFTIIVCVSNLTTKAQNKETVINIPSKDIPFIHYGFYLGGNKNTFAFRFNKSQVKHPKITVKSNYGFNLGLIGSLKLHDNINLRFEPGIFSNTKLLTFDHIEGEKYEKERRVGNTYLHLPLVFKFSVDRYKNIRPYVLGGGSYDYNFSSNESNINDNFTSEFRQKSNMFMYELGLGIDFYLEYFKFSPSIRAVFAINNEIKNDNKSPSPWTDPIAYMGTRGVYINLAFE